MGCFVKEGISGTTPLAPKNASLSYESSSSLLPLCLSLRGAFVCRVGDLRLLGFRSYLAYYIGAFDFCSLALPPLPCPPSCFLLDLGHSATLCPYYLQ